MAELALPAIIASAAMSVAGGVMGYQAGQYEADAAEQNAIAAAREGSVAAQIESMKSREALGRGRMLAASSGLEVSGSASDVLGAMAAEGDFSARNAIYLGRRRVQQANADKIGAKRRGAASLVQGIGQAGTILTSMSVPGGGAPTKAQVKGGV